MNGNIKQINATKQDIIDECRRKINLFVIENGRLPKKYEFNEMKLFDSSFIYLSGRYFDFCNYKEFLKNWLGYIG